MESSFFLLSEQPFRAQTIGHNLKSLAAHMIHNTEKLL